MSDSLLSIKSRLSSITSIQKTTKAMKLIASGRYAKWKSLLDGNDNYEKALRYSFYSCFQKTDLKRIKIPDVSIKNNSGKNLYVFITSNLGLCGIYNHDLFKLFESTVTSNDDVVFIGEKGYKHYSTSVSNSYADYLNLGDCLTYDKACEFKNWLDILYREKEYDSVIFIYTQYVNSLTTKATIKQVLPLDKTDIPEADFSIPEAIYEPNAYKLAERIISYYQYDIVYGLILQSNVSEQICRRNSMDMATSSADKLLQKMKLKYNKLRQQTITQEITEVVSGVNAKK